MFPSLPKNANLVSIHKKNEKNFVINYRLVSLLPISSKVFKRLLYNSIYKFPSNNNLLSQNQLGFRSGDSCIKVACRVKTCTTWTTKNTTSFHYFSKKIKTNTLQGHKRYIKLFELEINNLRVQILAAKMT